jgi:Xaa-Pro aminopeptidase
VSGRAEAAARRLGAAQEALINGGYDALLLADGTNLLFLSGYPFKELTLARPFYLFVPARGAPTLLVHDGRAAEARRSSWIGDVRTYNGLSVAPVAEVRAIVADHGLDRGRIGMELGFEQRLGIPVLELDRLRDALDPIHIEDAARLLWRLRAIKAPEDVACIRRACALTAAAYAHTFRQVRAGTLDRDVARSMSMSMSDAGGADPWVLITSGRSAYAFATGVPQGRALEPGDMVWMDAGCAVEGFWSDFSRAAVVGGPTASQLEAHATIAAITRSGVEMVRPGVPVADIAFALDAAIEGAGLPVTSWTSHLAGRVGHGIGYDITEPPHLSRSDPTLLEPGMVVTVEPGIATDDGLYHVEQNVLVTQGAPEVLSVSPWELTSLRA